MSYELEIVLLFINEIQTYFELFLLNDQSIEQKIVDSIVTTV
jgi:hypothetical protein